MTARSTSTAHYADKLDLLERIFGPGTTLADDAVVVGGTRLPVIDDVIIALPPDRRPASTGGPGEAPDFAPEVQATFGDQWQRYAEVTDEHRREFAQYFDLVRLDELADQVVADIGCGSGRYAACAAPYAGSLVLVDFSEAIFVARRNLEAHRRAVFVMGDVLDLPFRPGAFDLVYSLGVLHHLPVPALDALRRLLPLGSRFLVYLYYALDNRPWYFRTILAAADRVRRRLAGLRSPTARGAAVWAITLAAYWPMARLGSLLGPTPLQRRVPLAEFYAGKPLRRLRQDAHDRFLTPIEQRFTRAEIEGFDDDWDVRVSDGLPYWHFLCVPRGRADAAPPRSGAASEAGP